jgi:hypothetical protein
MIDIPLPFLFPMGQIEIPNYPIRIAYKEVILIDKALTSKERISPNKHRLVRSLSNRVRYCYSNGIPVQDNGKAVFVFCDSTFGSFNYVLQLQNHSIIFLSKEGAKKATASTQ